MDRNADYTVEIVGSVDPPAYGMFERNPSDIEVSPEIDLSRYNLVEAFAFSFPGTGSNTSESEENLQSLDSDQPDALSSVPVKT